MAKKPTTEKEKQSRVDRVLALVSSGKTQQEQLTEVMKLYDVGVGVGLRLLRRARLVARRRNKREAVDPREAAILRARQMLSDACTCGDFSARAAAERLLMDLEGTKAPEQVVIGANDKMAAAMAAMSAATAKPKDP